MTPQKIQREPFIDTFADIVTASVTLTEKCRAMRTMLVRHAETCNVLKDQEELYKAASLAEILNRANTQMQDLNDVLQWVAAFSIQFCGFTEEDMDAISDRWQAKVLVTDETIRLPGVAKVRTP